MGRVTLLIACVVGFIIVSGSVVSGAEMDDFDFSKTDKIIQNEFGNGVDTGDIISNILSDNGTSYIEKIKEIAGALVKNTVTENVSVYVKILILSVLSSAACCFVPQVNENQISDMTKMIITIVLFASVSGVYAVASKIALDTLTTLTDLYKSIIPIFFLSVTYVTGSVTTTAFYQVIIMIITLITTVYSGILFNINHGYLLVSLSDCITDKDRFKKLSELMSKIIKWTCRTLTTFVIGISGIKSLVAPSEDVIVKSAFVKAAALIPGIGETASSLASQTWVAANGVKNKIGVVAVVVLIAVCVTPLIKLLVMFISYKIAAAVIEPVADSGIVNAVDSLGESIGHFLILTASGVFMMIIVIVVICMGTSANGVK